MNIEKRGWRTKGAIALLYVSLVFTSLALHAAPVQAAELNLVPNPSLERSSGGKPTSWQTDTWGKNNATFTYAADGYTTAHSGYVSVTNYQSGDAKWYFSAVPVKASTQYTFTDYYKSNVVTHVVAAITNAQGTTSYIEAGQTAPVATVWTQGTASFKTPANAKTLTIFHLINANGWLQIDEASVIENAVSQVVDFVPNNSVETVSNTNQNLPAQWSHSKWGNNTAKYEYLSTGKAGSRSVKVTVSNYKTGDAKWVYTPQPLTQGLDYRFTAWYKTNTVPHVVAQYIKDDGTEDFFGLPDPEPTGTGWQKYSDVFTVPAGVKSVSLFFFLSSNGWVQTDDYHVTPYTYTGFNRGLVTLTFDDGFEENVSTVLPVLDQYGFKATQCDATEYVEGIPAQVAIAQEFIAHGHELCSHTVTHPYLTQLTQAQIDTELTHSKNFLEQISGQPVTDFSSPYGDYNVQVNNEIKKYFSSHRTTDEGFNSKDNFNPYRLRVQNMQSTTTLAQFQEWVSKAQADHTWLILIYHVVGTQNLEQFDTQKPDFDAQMAWLAQSGVTVSRWDAALKELSLQTP